MLGSGLWRSGGRLILLPLLATIAVCALALVIVTATFAANATATPAPSPPAGAVQAPGGPTFEVATASSDEPVVVADFVKADDANTSFGDMLVSSLRTSPRVSDFGSLEHEYSPKAATRRVTSGDAVLAVLVGSDFSRTFRHNMFSALRGGPVRPLPITVIAGPQALADNKLILREYRRQAIKPTLDYLADEMRIVVKKSGCDLPGTVPGRCVTVTDAMLDKFAGPFHVAVNRVHGPAAKSYDYPSKQHSAADPPVVRPPPVTQAAPTMNTLSVVMVLIVLAGLVAATTTAWAVDYRLGRAAITTGPWRRQNTEMPFPRSKTLMVKSAAGITVGALSSSLLIGVYLARSGRLSRISVPEVADNALLWAFAMLVAVAIVLTVQALQAMIGTPGWLVGAAAVIGFGLPAAGVGSLLAGEFGTDGAILRAAGPMVHSAGLHGAIPAGLPVAAALLAIAAASYAAGHLASRAYDKHVTTAAVPRK